MPAKGRASNPWTKQEKQEVKLAYLKQESIKDTAGRHKQTVGAIRKCLIRLGFTGTWQKHVAKGEGTLP